MEQFIELSNPQRIARINIELALAELRHCAHTLPKQCMFHFLSTSISLLMDFFLPLWCSHLQRGQQDNNEIKFYYCRGFSLRIHFTNIRFSHTNSKNRERESGRMSQETSISHCNRNKRISFSMNIYNEVD